MTKTIIIHTSAPRPPKRKRVIVVNHPSRRVIVIVKHPSPPEKIVEYKTTVEYPCYGEMNRNAYVWSEPDKRVPHLQPITRGTRVLIKGKTHGFYAATLPDGFQGWLVDNAVRLRRDLH